MKYRKITYIDHMSDGFPVRVDEHVPATVPLNEVCVTILKVEECNCQKCVQLKNQNAQRILELIKQSKLDLKELLPKLPLEVLEGLRTALEQLLLKR